MTKWLNVKKTLQDKGVLLSPLGWNAGARLLWAAGTSALLWLCVAWALDW